VLLVLAKEERMMPMIDTMVFSDVTTALMTVGPAFAGVMIAMIAGAAWLARGTAEELRRIAARDWERGIPTTRQVSGSSRDIAASTAAVGHAA
jgi:hypothetical protein